MLFLCHQLSPVCITYNCKEGWHSLDLGGLHSLFAQRRAPGREKGAGGVGSTEDTEGMCPRILQKLPRYVGKKKLAPSAHSNQPNVPVTKNEWPSQAEFSEKIKEFQALTSRAFTII